MYDMENMDPDYTDNRSGKEKLKDLGFGCLITGGVCVAFVGCIILADCIQDAINNHKAQRIEQPQNQINSMDKIKIKNYSDTIKTIKR